jgi:hypothetical protein
MERCLVTGGSPSRAQCNLLIVAGERPSRSAFSIYFSAIAPNVAPAASFFAMHSRRFAVAEPLPLLALDRAASCVSVSVTVAY